MKALPFVTMEEFDDPTVRKRFEIFFSEYSEFFQALDKMPKVIGPTGQAKTFPAEDMWDETKGQDLIKALMNIEKKKRNIGAPNKSD